MEEMTFFYTLIDSAKQARRIAAEYRRDADDCKTSQYWREKWLADADRADERAEWLENHAKLFAPPAEMEAAA